MITYAQAMAAVQGKVCPRCLHTELSAELQLDDGSECVCTARCEHCGEQFVVEYTRFEALDEIHARVQREIADIPCAVCEADDYVLGLRCEHPSQDCYFEARCGNCSTRYRTEYRYGRVALAQVEA